MGRLGCVSQRQAFAIGGMGSGQGGHGVEGGGGVFSIMFRSVVGRNGGGITQRPHGSCVTICPTAVVLPFVPRQFVPK